MQLQVVGDIVTPKKTLKVLCTQLYYDLSWNSHAGRLKQKAVMALRKLIFLGKFIDFHGMKRIITTHLFGILYNTSAVWLNELLQ